MVKLSSSFKNMLLSLLFICLLAAGLLAKVNDMTKEPIADAKALKLEEAIKDVVPDFDNNPVSESYKLVTDSGDSLLVYPAKKGDEVVGFAVNSYSDNGFSGNIQVMVGFDMESNVVNYAVLSHAETPGLGSQMTDWFKPQVHEPSLLERIFGFEIKKAEVKSSIIGKNPGTTQFAVSKDGGDIDAISASTVTSRAFLEAINKAYVAYTQSESYSSTGATLVIEKDTTEIKEN